MMKSLEFRSFRVAAQWVRHELEQYYGRKCPECGKHEMEAPVCRDPECPLAKCDTASKAKAEGGMRQSVADELKALGVSEPTEEERFLRREEDKRRRWLRKTDIEAEGGTEHG